MVAAIIIASIVLLVGFFSVAYLIGYDRGLWDRKEAHGGKNKSTAHEYKSSDDYHRLWKLLHEGRRVITISQKPLHHFVTDARISYDVIYGCGDAIDLSHDTDFTEEDFCMRCKLSRLVFLDQIDEYEDNLK